MPSYISKSLPEQIAEKITHYIIENNLQVGDKIPNEFELGEILGAGRSSIREAVRILASRNILVIKQGAGTFVADNTGVSADPLGLIFTKDRYKLAKDLIQVRIILEPEIAAIAANKATEENIKEIYDHCGKVEELINSRQNHMLEDVKFHEAIARCTDNIVIEKLIPIINTSVAVFANITSRQLREETITTHRAIADAIAGHNSEDAKHAMTMHMLYNKFKIEEIVNSKDNIKPL